MSVRHACASARAVTCVRVCELRADLLRWAVLHAPCINAEAALLEGAGVGEHEGGLWCKVSKREAHEAGRLAWLLGLQCVRMTLVCFALHV